MSLFKFFKNYLRGHWRFLGGLALALAFCLTGQVLLSAISNRLKSTVQRDAAKFLASDFVFQSSVKPTDEMLSSLEALKNKYSLNWIRQIDIVYVGESKATPLNVRVRILEGAYPFYGPWKVQSQQGLTQVSDLQDGKKIFVEARLRTQGYAEGDVITLGGVPFQIVGFVEDEPQAATSLLFPGALVILHRNQMAGTGLEDPELRAFHRFLFQSPQDSALRKLSDKDLQKKLRLEVPYPHLRIVTPQRANQQADTVIKRLLSFLNVLQLVGWVLGSLGVFMILRHFLWKELPSFLLLRCLGISEVKLWTLFLGTATFLVLLAGVMGTTCGLWFESKVAQFLGQQLAIDFETRKNAWVYAGEAFGVSFLILLPSLVLPVVNILRASGSALMGVEHLEASSQSLGDYLGLSAIFFIVTFWMSEGWVSWLVFWGLTFLLSLLFAAVYAILRKLFGRVSLGRPLSWSLSWLQFVRRPAFAQSSLIGMGSSLTLILSLWLIGHSYLTQIDIAENQGLPNLISVNVSDEEAPKLASILEGFSQEHVAIVQGRLVDVKPPKEVPEEFSDEETRERFLTREYTMTLREGEGFRLGEKLVEGSSLFGEKVSDAVRVSVTQDLAKRMNWRLGERFRMNVAGVELTMQIQSLRKVQWFNLQPNFFIVLNAQDVPGIPKQNLVLATVAREKMTEIQKRILKELPQVTPLDTLALTERLMKIFRQITQMVFGSLIYSFFAGGLLFLGASLARRRSFQEERALGWAMGMSQMTQKKWVLSEAILISSIAVFSALLLGAGVATLLSHFVLEMDLMLPNLWALLAAIATPLFGFVLVHASVQR